MNWRIERVEVSKLKEWHKNPRVLTKKGLEDLTKSIKKFGVAEPLVCNTDFTICGGHGRLKVIKELGINEIDVYIPERTLTEKQFEELNIRLNKNIAGQFDFDVLANEFEQDELIEWGFEEEELVGLFIEDKTDEELDDATEPQKEAISKLGDIFLLGGKHRVMCGDSTKAEEVSVLMDGKKADMVFADPPYDIGDQSYSKNIELFTNNAHIFIMHDDRGIVEYLRNSNLDFMRFYVANFGFSSPRGNDPYLSHILVSQEKKGDAIKHSNLHDGLRSIIPMEYRFRLKDDLTIHKHQKPVKFITIFIKHFSNNDTIVFDLFLGSGSTLIACEQTNRICYGMELDPIYIDVILKRYHKLYPEHKIECVNRDFDFSILFEEIYND